MSVNWQRRWFISCAALLLAGCASATDVYPTSPSATSQLLVFRALERAVGKLDLTRLRGRRVALEVSSQLGDHKFAAAYLETWLRAQGVTVDWNSPEMRLQAYFYSLGTDRGQTFVGIPPFQLPVLSVPVPEIALFKWVRNRGRADVRLFAFDPRTDTLVETLPDVTGRSKFDDYTVLVVVGFSVTDVDKPLAPAPSPGKAP